MEAEKEQIRLDLIEALKAKNNDLRKRLSQVEDREQKNIDFLNKRSLSNDHKIQTLNHRIMMIESENKRLMITANAAVEVAEKALNIAREVTEM